MSLPRISISRPKISLGTAVWAASTATESVLGLVPTVAASQATAPPAAVRPPVLVAPPVADVPPVLVVAPPVFVLPPMPVLAPPVPVPPVPAPPPTPALQLYVQTRCPPATQLD